VLHLLRAAIMQQVPEQQGGFVRVPKISTGADSAPASAAASATSSVDSAASTATASWSSSDDEAAAAAADVSGPVTAEEAAALQALDVRVGRIISCERHPDADRCADALHSHYAALGLVACGRPR
jgi:hypothetical protein